MLEAGKMLVSTCLPRIRFKFDSQNQGMMVWMETDEFMGLAGHLTSPTCQILDQGKLSPKEGRQCWGMTPWLSSGICTHVYPHAHRKTEQSKTKQKMEESYVLAVGVWAWWPAHPSTSFQLLGLPLSSLMTASLSHFSNSHRCKWFLQLKKTKSIAMWEGNSGSNWKEVRASWLLSQKSHHVLSCLNFACPTKSAYSCPSRRRS